MHIHSGKYGLIYVYKDEYYNLDGCLKVRHTQTKPNLFLNPQLIGL